ncbi:MAG: hypothetical protein ACYS6K_06270 [Planctomycetota bacterium]|jgi:hypothetical protein
MNVQKEPAARFGQRAASKTKLQNTPYYKATILSNLKQQIGELLLFGDIHHINFWKRFESELRRYSDLLTKGVDYE